MTDTLFNVIMIVLIAFLCGLLIWLLWQAFKDDREKDDEGEDDEDPPSGGLPIASKHFYRNTTRFGAMNIGR